MAIEQTPGCCTQHVSLPHLAVAGGAGDQLGARDGPVVRKPRVRLAVALGGGRGAAGRGGGAGGNGGGCGAGMGGGSIVTREELQAIVVKHQLWLNGAKGGRGADLSGADLRGADLSGADLSGADLSGAVLRGADLRGVEIPVIEEIDAAILAAVQRGGCSLNKRTWHSCETTHCRAGWAIHLAGKAGSKLEASVGSCVAGALIYAKSRPDKPVPNFFACNSDALADLQACAAEGQS